MPPGSRHLKASSTIQVEFSDDHPQKLRQAVPEMLFHFAWSFLDSISITNLCQAAPVMSSYGNLRDQAASMSEQDIISIRQPLHYAEKNLSIDTIRATNVAKLLLLCDFDIGAWIRVLGGNYTSEFLHYADIDACLLALSTIQPERGEPRHNFKHLSYLFHEHAPLKANFRCRRQDMLQRNQYNNHRAADPHLESIHQKTATDVQKSYAIAIPRWLLRFTPGLFLAALGYAIREAKGKVKGRQVNDPSALITGEDDTGALNSHIDRKDPIAMPPVHYQSALQRLWKRVYNLRVNHPDEEVIIYKDDLVSAFRRLRYHPDAAAAYSYVLGKFLVIPIGMVFGARDAPSLFCMLSELRSFASKHAHKLPLSKPLSSMIDEVQYAHPVPHPHDLAPAYSDSRNKGIDGSSVGHQPTFVDDTIMAELRSVIRIAAENSVFTASIFVGCKDLVEEPVSMEKFERFFSHTNETLGFVTDSRTLTASYPEHNKQSLSRLLASSDWTPQSAHPIRTLARILGKIRHVAQILPFGSHLSIHLQLCLSKFILRKIRHKSNLTNMKKIMKQAWNNRHTVKISAAAARDLRHLASLMLSDDTKIWRRPLSLLIPRDPHFIGQSDACNVAMGGLSVHLGFQWRLSNRVFNNLPDWVNSQSNEPQWHINIHEFIAIIINSYFMMLSFTYHHSMGSSRIPDADGWIFLLQADNTSALSWMKHLSRSREAHITQLCHLYSSLTFAFNSLHPSRFDGQHLAGKLNQEADALSRPADYPSYNDIFRSYPGMLSLPAFRVPRTLICAINACLSKKSTKEILKGAIEPLSSSRLYSFKLGASDWASKILH